jgi:hypothetical protein
VGLSSQMPRKATIDQAAEHRCRWGRLRLWLRPMIPEVSSLLAAISELLEALRRSVLLAERLAARASLTADEARDVCHEIETARQGIERLDAMLLRRQDLREM